MAPSTAPKDVETQHRSPPQSNQTCEKYKNGISSWGSGKCHNTCATCDNSYNISKQWWLDSGFTGQRYDGCSRYVSIYKCTSCRNMWNFSAPRQVRRNTDSFLLPASEDGKVGACRIRRQLDRIDCASVHGKSVTESDAFSCVVLKNHEYSGYVYGHQDALSRSTGLSPGAVRQELASPCYALTGKALKLDKAMSGRKRQKYGLTRSCKRGFSKSNTETQVITVKCAVYKMVRCSAPHPASGRSCTTKKYVACLEVCGGYTMSKTEISDRVIAKGGDASAAAVSASSLRCKTGPKWCLPTMCSEIASIV